MPLEEETYQVRLPKSLTSTKQLITRRPADDKVLREINAPDTIKATDKRLAALLVDSCYYRADKVGPEALLVQGGGDQVGHGGGRDVALLAQAVHVDLVAEQIRDGGDVRREPREAQVDVAVGEDLGEVVADRQGLETEAQIAGYGYAVFANHCYAGAAI